MLLSKKFEFYSDLISWEQCLPLWKKLWSDRLTPIEPVSHMKFLGGYTEQIGEPFFIGAFINSDLIGCNSFHRVDNTFRSRGLYVEPQYRQLGIGEYLLKETVYLCPGMVWSFPRAEALPVYLNSGFACSNEIYVDQVEDKTNFYVSRYKPHHVLNQKKPKLRLSFFKNPLT